jgi:hypothetical protein
LATLSLRSFSDALGELYLDDGEFVAQIHEQLSKKQKSSRLLLRISLHLTSFQKLYKIFSVSQYDPMKAYVDMMVEKIPFRCYGGGDQRRAGWGVCMFPGCGQWKGQRGYRVLELLSKIHLF